MVLLTFNIITIEASCKKETFVSDVDRLKITVENTRAILRILDIHDIKASFFVEISIAEKLRDLLKAISFKGHEIAFYNQNSGREEVENVKRSIQDFLEKPIKGIRQKNVKIELSDLKLMEFNMSQILTMLTFCSH